jgi:integrase
MLHLRGSTYYSIISVPLACQPVLGRRELWKSLRTSNLEEAKLLSLRVTAEARRMFEGIKKRAAAPRDPASVARAYAAKFLAHRDSGDHEALELVYSDALESFLDQVESGDTSGINKLLDDVLLEEGLHVPPSKRPEYAQALLQAHLGVLRKKAAGVVAVAGPSMMELLDSYLRERKLGSKSEAETRAAYSRFVALVGDKQIREVTKADVRLLRERLFSAPSNRAGSVDGKLSPTSVKKLLGICATVFRFGVGQGLLDASPFDGGLTRVMKGTQTERRMPYRRDDLRVIFGSEEFGKLVGVKRWLPLVALYSGCRMEEGGGLRVADVREDQGVRFFSFEPTSERRLKNEGSRRSVPVHPELIRMGLLDYVGSLPTNGRLFPDLKPGPHGKLTGAFSKWWARFSDERGVSDAAKAFHSLRHSFKDACRDAGVSEDVHDRLTGHANGGVGRSYGRGASLPVLAEAVSKIKFGIEVE